MEHRSQAQRLLDDIRSTLREMETQLKDSDDEGIQSREAVSHMGESLLRRVRVYMHDKIIYFVSSFSEQIVHELRELTTV